jgi:small subunit ribosomal protein S13
VNSKAKIKIIKMAEQKQQKPVEQKQEQKVDNFKHIVRIANVDIPGEKHVKIALTKIKGVGTILADVFCKLANIDRQKKAGYLTPEEIVELNKVVNDPLSNGLPLWMINRKNDYETGEDKHLLTGTLNFVQDNDLKRLKKIKTLRGIRHQRKLPVRGQRTRSNFRKGKGKVVGVKKKGTPGKK